MKRQPEQASPRGPEISQEHVIRDLKAVGV